MINIGALILSTIAFFLWGKVVFDKKSLEVSRILVIQLFLVAVMLCVLAFIGYDLKRGQLFICLFVAYFMVLTDLLARSAVKKQLAKAKAISIDEYIRVKKKYALPANSRLIFYLIIIGYFLLSVMPALN